ncbi:MAG: hypothetical protein JSS43_10025 [Proteobacteria bacterium]|nr:hypothetical protein [Pseudomonadota bacterium]
MSPSHAADAPSFRLFDDALTIRPYVLNQFDLGGAWGASQRNPTGGFNVRRLRYGVQADLPDDLSVRFIWDFGDSGFGWPQYRSTGLYEAAIHYKGLKPFTLTAGAFAPNLTLEGGQRAADKLFSADPTIIDLVGTSSVNGGQLGIQLSADGPRWLVETAFTGGRVGDSGSSRQRGVLARAAGLVVKQDDLDVHLGVSAVWSFRTPQAFGSPPGITYASTPEYDIPGRSTIDTGSIPARGTLNVGPEFGFAYGPLWFQAEWYPALVSRTDGPDPSFSGWYAQAAWTLIGQPRQWRPSAGSWGAPSPHHAFDPAHGHWGALEAGARFSQADLNSAGISGGTQSIWTAGVNWWLWRQLRIGLQWQRAHITGQGGTNDFQTGLIRVQIFFH